MPALRLQRRLAALAFTLSTRRLAAAPIVACAMTLAPPAHAQAEAYKLHMDNGVKLYNDRNYPAAVVEFKAAYDARPSPNPLVNIALCEKALFRYPKAIAALETALAKHGQVMDPADRTAAADAIKEMRALLGTVIVKLTPAKATVIVDGEELPPGAAGKPLALGPGAHRIEARADGFAGAERSVTVASGQTQEISLDLAPDKGLVTIVAPDAKMTIAVDQRVVGAGAWSGLLAPGPHVVQMYGVGQTPYDAQIVVVAGKPLDVRAGGEVPPGNGAVIPVNPKKGEIRRGLYLLGTGSILFSAVHPPSFDKPTVSFGGAYGLRIGFQVNDTAGFDLSYEHSSISTSRSGDESGERGYRILADRVAASLRLTSPGKTWRFVGVLGGGLVVDGVKFGNDARASCVKPLDPMCPLQNGGEGALGLDAFALAEALLELDVDRVLIDFGIEAQFQSTGNLQTNVTVNGASREVALYGANPIINVGPAFRVGYRFW